MRIHHHRRGGYQKKVLGPVYLANDMIRSPEVRVVDEESKPLGVLSIAQALTVARERGYDLVEVSPKAIPPVCRLLDFGQFKYEKEKELKAQKAHAKRVEVKGIRLSVRMGTHDIDIRQGQALEFLRDGQKLKLEIHLRGREKEHGDLAVQRIDGFVASLQTHYPLFIEQPTSRSGGNVSSIVGRKA